MKNALLISENEILKNLYSVNLSVYVGLKVTATGNIERATNKIGKKAKYEILVFFIEESNESKFTSFVDEVKALDSKIQIVLVDARSDTEVDLMAPVGVLLLENAYNIKNIIKSSARLLKVTAKEMASMKVPDMFPISRSLIANIKNCPCDVFIKNENEEFEQIGVRGEAPSKTEEELVIEGRNEIYIPKNERLNFINFVSTDILIEYRSSLDKDAQLNIVENCMEKIGQQFTSNQLAREEITNLSKTCSEIISDIVIAEESFSNMLETLLKNNASYLFVHNVLILYVVEHILKNVTWGSHQQFEKLSLAVFFHDIFLVPVYDSVNDFYKEEELLYNPQTDEDHKEIILNHARMAAEKVAELNGIPMGVNAIICQHHGEKRGEGFNLNPVDSLAPLSKVFMISESYVDMFLDCIREKKKFDKALVVKKLNEQYTRRSYQKLIETLKSLK